MISSWIVHEERANFYLKLAFQILSKDGENTDIELKKADVFATMAQTHAQLSILRHSVVQR